MVEAYIGTERQAGRLLGPEALFSTGAGESIRGDS